MCGIEIVMEQNIYKIAYNSINKLERPSYLSKITSDLCRKSLGVLHDISKPKFTRLEIKDLPLVKQTNLVNLLYR